MANPKPYCQIPKCLNFFLSIGISDKELNYNLLVFGCA